MYSIGELAALLGVAIVTLRRWHQADDRRTSGAGLSQAWGISPRAGQETGCGDAVKRLPKRVCEKLGPSGPRVVTYATLCVVACSGFRVIIFRKR